MKRLLNNNWDIFGTSRHEIKSNHPKFFPMKMELGSKSNLDLINAHLPFKAVIHCAAKLPHSVLTNDEIDNYYSCNYWVFVFSIFF